MKTTLRDVASQTLKAWRSLVRAYPTAVYVSRLRRNQQAYFPADIHRRPPVVKIALLLWSCLVWLWWKFVELVYRFFLWIIE